MLIITDAQSMTRVMTTTSNPWLRHLLALRRNQILAADVEIGELGPLIIVEPGDALADIETAIGVSIATNLVDGAVWPSADFVPSFEWCRARHGLHELVYVLSDDGAGAIVFVPDRKGIDPTLLAIIQRFGDREQQQLP